MARTLEEARSLFRIALLDAGVNENVDGFLAVARPALIYHPAASAIERDPSLVNRPEGETNEDDIPLGATKVGGRADLPAGSSWPGDTLSFVVQFDLARLPPDVIDLDLPREGHLALFADPEDGVAGKLIWIGPYEGRLARAEPPDAATLHLPRRLSHEVVLTLDFERPGVPASDSEPDLASDAPAVPQPEDCIQLGGDPRTLTDRLAEACEQRDAELDPLSGDDAEWRLVLRVGSIEECEMDWNGSLYVWMRTGDIRERRFDNAVIVRDSD